MIHVDRGPAPSYFRSDRWKREHAKLAAHYRAYGSRKRQETAPAVTFALEARIALADAFGSKCAYCESPIEMDDRGTKSTRADQRSAFDHFRPARGARGFGPDSRSSAGGAYHETHYWWLSLDWDNMLLSCHACQRAKGAWFPLDDESRRAAPPGVEGPSVEDEGPLLLDPCSDRPTEHLRYRDDGRVEALTERGRVTIELLALNRQELVGGRREALGAARAHFDEVAEDVEGRNAFAVSLLADVLRRVPVRLPFLAIQRQYLEGWLADNPEVDRLVRAEVHAEMDDDYAVWVESQSAAAGPALAPEAPFDLGRVAIERIEIRNFKNLERLTVRVPQNPAGAVAPWLVFLGENAVGKSSVLQAVALTLMGDSDRSDLPGVGPGDVLRYYRDGDGLVDTDEGSVTIWEVGREDPLWLRFRKGQGRFESNVAEPRTTLIAYGSTRLLPDADSVAYESAGRVRVRNLFRPSTPLVDAEEWLYGLSESDPVQFDLVVRGLRELLLMGEGETLTPDPDRRRVLVDLEEGTTTISKLSDGYRTTLALACDLMSMLSREGTSMEEAEGVVMIDELGANLHPSWRKRVVASFRRVFPRVQFVVSTHEPLCLRGLSAGETVLLRRDLEGAVVAISDLPNPGDLRVDELLASEFFGLNTTLESDLEDVYDEYYKLLLVKRPNKSQERRMAELKGTLREREHLGHGLRDELMYEVIDKLLARELHASDPRPRPELKRETLERVLEAWSEAGLAAPEAAP